MFGLIKENVYWIIKRLCNRKFWKSLACSSNGCIKCVYLNNGPCQARPTIVHKNSNEPLYFPFTVSVSVCDGGCNTIDNPYARVCIPDKKKF